MHDSVYDCQRCIGYVSSANDLLGVLTAAVAANVSQWKSVTIACCYIYMLYRKQWLSVLRAIAAKELMINAALLRSHPYSCRATLQCAVAAHRAERRATGNTAHQHERAMYVPYEL
jgi:hypothetical protein